jgi:hypothetical protein
MTVETWLKMAVADANRRGLPGLEPLLESLARATRALRAADFNDTADGSHQATGTGSQSAGVGGEPRAVDSRS